MWPWRHCSTTCRTKPLQPCGLLVWEFLHNNVEITPSLQALLSGKDTDAALPKLPPSRILCPIMLFALNCMLQECGMHPFLVALLELTCRAKAGAGRLLVAGSFGMAPEELEHYFFLRQHPNSLPCGPGNGALLGAAPAHAPVCPYCLGHGGWSTPYRGNSRAVPWQALVSLGSFHAAKAWGLCVLCLCGSTSSAASIRR